MPWFRPPEYHRQHSVPWLVVGFAVGALLLLLAALAFLKSQALDHGERLQQSLAEVIGEQTSRTLQTVDARLRAAAMLVGQAEAERPHTANAGAEVLREQKQGLPFVHSLWVLDAEGRVVHDSEPGHIGVSLADRDYFQVHKSNPATGFYVGPQVKGRVSDNWIMTASRPLPAPDGKFRGIVVAALDPAYFQQLWRSIDLGDDGMVALFRVDGRLMLRSPPDASVLGRDFSNLPLFTQHLPRAPHGVFMAKSPVDSVVRVSGYRQLPEFPGMVVLVGSSYANMLAEWQRFAVLTLMVWAAAAIGVGLLGSQLRQQLHRTSVSEARFRQLAQAMPQIVVTCDARGKVVFVNQRWAEATGRDVSTALGAGWMDLLHPDDRESAAATLAAARASGQEAQHEHRLLYRDGVYRWQLLRAVPVRDELGAIVSWYGTSTDIDALKQAQVNLKSQADLLSMAGRLARMGGWQADLGSQRLMFSDEAAAILDLDPADTPHLDLILELIVPRDREIARQAVDACIVHGAPFDVVVEVVTPRGRHVWVRSIGQPVLDAEGNVVRLQGAQQDITQRVQLMEQIRELNTNLEHKIAQRTGELARQEALFRALAEQAPLPIWTVDPDGAATFLSRAFYELAGGAPPRWQGYEWMELVHPDDREEVRARWARSRETGTTYAGTRRLRAKDGTYHTMTYRATPVRTPSGEIEFWVGVDTDITELMANEAALRLANEQLEAFSYSVSHDLRSPLQRIASFAQLLQEQLPEPPPARALHYLARIRANVDHMGQLIEGLLTLAQVSQLEVVRTPVDLSQLAAEILDRLQAEDLDRQVAWRVDPGLAVLGDVRLMRSVMDNLLGNAWKFTSRTEHAEIHVGFDAAQGEFFVRDNGAGFDMMFADRLFGTFQRLHRQDEFPGTGIGLATVARAVSRQGGCIRAESAPGRGATFYFTLPVPR